VTFFFFGATAPRGPGPSSCTRFLYHTQQGTTVSRTDAVSVSSISSTIPACSSIGWQHL